MSETSTESPEKTEPSPEATNPTPEIESPNIVNNTLESLKNEVVELRKRYDNELKTLSEQNTNLTNQLKEQDALIGDYKDKLFNTNIPYESVENNFDIKDEYERAFTSVYNHLKHRLTENKNKKMFLRRCMEIYNGNNI